MKRILFLLMVAFTCLQANAQTDKNYINEYGRLKLVGKQLCDKNGNPVQLKGWSTFGLQWTTHCYTKDAVAQMKLWGANIVRGAMYVSEGGYNADPNGMTNRVKDMIKWSAEAGMYYLCDWHTLGEGTNDPNNTTNSAKTFFNEITSYVTQNNYTHVLYEICNEPNGVDWSKIKTYANQVLPIIEKGDPGAVVCVGTPQWDQLPDQAANSPITGYPNLNIMYSFHFYACSHTQFLSNLDNATRNIPIFITEWGTGIYSGGAGQRDGLCESAAKQLMIAANKNNQGGQLISWCNWAWGDKNEQASALMDCGSKKLSNSGEIIVDYLGGCKDCEIPTPVCFGDVCTPIPGIWDLGRYDQPADEDVPADCTKGCGEGLVYHEENTTSDEETSRIPCNGAYMWSGEDYNFRSSECVDVSGCYGITGAEGWYGLGYIEPGEWEVYTLDVAEAGYYSIEALLNPTTFQYLTISSMTYVGEPILVDLDQSTSDKPKFEDDLSFATTLTDKGNDNWKYWAWHSPVEDIEYNSSTKVNTGILFKRPGKQTVKISWLTYEGDDITAKGDFGPIKLAKVMDYTGSVDVEEASSSSFSIYPNPSNGEFSIALGDADNAQVSIVNALGQVVYSANIVNGETISGLKKGSFIVTVKTETSCDVQKLIVK